MGAQLVLIRDTGLLALVLLTLFSLLLLELVGLLLIYQPSLFQLIEQRVTHFDSMWEEKIDFTCLPTGLPDYLGVLIFREPLIISGTN